MLQKLYLTKAFRVLWKSLLNLFFWKMKKSSFSRMLEYEYYNSMLFAACASLHAQTIHSITYLNYSDPESLFIHILKFLILKTWKIAFILHFSCASINLKFHSFKLTLLAVPIDWHYIAYIKYVKKVLYNALSSPK